MTAEKQTDQLDAMNSAADASDDFLVASARTEAASAASFAGSAQDAPVPPL